VKHFLLATVYKCLHCPLKSCELASFPLRTYYRKDTDNFCNTNMFSYKIRVETYVRIRISQLTFQTAAETTRWSSCVLPVSALSHQLSTTSFFIAKPETPIREKQIVFTYCSVRYLSVFLCPRSFMGVPQMGGYNLLKSNGGDSGNRIFVLY
jgi:hypothetical protein